MPRHDPYEALIGYYEFIMGPLPRRAEFMRAVASMVSPEDLRVFFLIPMTSPISRDKLEKKARMPSAELVAALDRLAGEGLIMAYTEAGRPVYERANPVYMTEQQVRKAEDTPRRRFYAEFFNAILSGEFAPAAPNVTPYYRVLPAEAAVTQEGRRTLRLEVPIPDPRGVLPIDVVSEMARRGSEWIAVADCYCRKTKRLVGEGCDYPLETCLVFGKVAEALVNHGTARRIDYDEAMAILRRSEELGLVHNVDNCEGEIGSICNCCACCSILLNTWRRGVRNADSPSRYVVAYDRERCLGCQACIARCPSGARALAGGKVTIEADLCLGCGLCVTGCAQGANRMELRQRLPRLPRTGGELSGKLAREALLGIVKRKILGR